MNYNKFLFFLLFNFSLCAALHAGMQDRAYNEVLIDNVTHPNGGNVTLDVGPDGRIYLSYGYTYDSTIEDDIDGWVEVYSAEGVLLTTIDRSYISYFSDNPNSTFGPEKVLPGPGGIFTIREGYWGESRVFDSNFQEYRPFSGYRDGWTRSLDGGFVTFNYDGGFYLQIRDGNNSIIETTLFESKSISDISLNGYTLTYTTRSYYDENGAYVPSRRKNITFDVDGVIQSRDDLSPINMGGNDKYIGFPTIANNQVVVPRRAYRTKGDTNSIPVPSIVSVAQVPDTTLIDITYRVDDVDDATVTTGILASMTDGQGNTTRIPLATLAGGTSANLGAAVATNTDLTVTWDAGVDWGAAFGDVSFDVYANDGRPVLGFHMLTLPLPSGDLTISRSPVNDLEIKEALYYLWATGQGIRLDNGRLVGQGGVFEGASLGTPEAPVTDTSTDMLFYQLGLEEASEAQVNAARQSFDTVYKFTPKNPIRGDLLYNSSLPSSVNELGFDTTNDDSVSYITGNSGSWVVPATTLQALGESLSIPGAGGNVSFTLLDPSNEGWSISNLPDWLTASASSGVGDATITLSAATENANIDIRSATVDINNGATSITVSQNSNIFPDNFADRYALTGNSGSFTISNVNATTESGEPTHYEGGENSLWFTFTAPGSGEFYFDVSANYSTSISIYLGDELAALESYNSEIYNAYIYPSQGGQTYHIAVSTPNSNSEEYSGEPGDLNISYYFYSYDDEGI